jgi:hypothetical protein
MSFVYIGYLFKWTLHTYRTITASCCLEAFGHASGLAGFATVEYAMAEAENRKATQFASVKPTFLEMEGVLEQCLEEYSTTVYIQYIETG